jgi:hypothetical protein
LDLLFLFGRKGLDVAISNVFLVCDGKIWGCYGGNVFLVCSRKILSRRGSNNLLNASGAIGAYCVKKVS